MEKHFQDSNHLTSLHTLFCIIILNPDCINNPNTKKQFGVNAAVSSGYTVHAGTQCLLSVTETPNYGVTECAGSTRLQRKKQLPPACLLLIMGNLWHVSQNFLFLCSSHQLDTETRSNRRIPALHTLLHSVSSRNTQHLHFPLKNEHNS